VISAVQAESSKTEIKITIDFIILGVSFYFYGS